MNRNILVLLGNLLFGSVPTRYGEKSTARNKDQRRPIGPTSGANMTKFVARSFLRERTLARVCVIGGEYSDIQACHDNNMKNLKKTCISCLA